MYFEWDEGKSQSNILKHGVSFEDARDVFDGAPVVYFDADSWLNEDRYVAIGFSAARLMAVIFVNPGVDTVRIISARKASKFEEKRYERGY
nr:BrnT family toxin [uncultured Duganella sp.]